MEPMIEEGKLYLFFTVTFYFVGRVVAINHAEVKLADCWLVYSIENVASALEKGTTVGEHALLGDFVLRSYIGASPWRAKPLGKAR